MYEESSEGQRLVVGAMFIVAIISTVSFIASILSMTDSPNYASGRVTSTAKSCNSGGIFPDSCQYVVVVNAKGYSASFGQYSALRSGDVTCVALKGLLVGSVADASHCKPAASPADGLR